MPTLNVFVKRDRGVYHSYATELLYAPSEPGQNCRHVDVIWPLWNLFDLTPKGRGTSWYPRLSYLAEPLHGLAKPVRASRLASCEHATPKPWQAADG